MQTMLTSLRAACACAALATATLGAETGTPTARPLLGTIVVKVPAGIIGTNYWVYVNKHIVSAPPHEDFAALDIVAVATPNGTEYFRSEQGRVISIADGSYTQIAEGIDKLLFQEVTVKVAPGDYTVELMAKVADGAQGGSYVFPFVVKDSSYTAEVEAGASVTVTATPPPGWGATAAFAAAAASAESTDPRTLALGANTDFERAAKAYYADKVVKALFNVEAMFSTNPPFRPSVYIDFPDDVGGPREFDADQVDAIVDSIARCYHYDFGTDAVERYKQKAPGYSAFFDELAGRVEQFNKGIEDLHTISEKLRKASH